ncbi:MAG: alkaline ceramidase [Pirellulaceae bacterium]|jgi:hypothetical protein|nr:alkaline ceramidase [Pirellulaceae bacterium]
MTRVPRLRVAEPSFAGDLGLARRDITPPVGIYARMWGCARHDVAEGIHRPLYVTALACRPPQGAAPFLLVSLDLGWWRSRADEWFLRGAVLEALGLDPARLMLQTAHTHAGPATSRDAGDKPGGDRIPAYLEHVRQATVDAAREALAQAEPALLTWATGRCALAVNRDLPHPDGGGVLCGYNPDQPADDTILVGRLTRANSTELATLVNYACHPTSLGGDNRRISPDYIGALREVVEGATGGAPCLFLQGASGELAPRRQYAGDVQVADANGRQVGYAALSALSGMLPPGQALAFAGAQASGAPLGIWQLVPTSAGDLCRCVQTRVVLPVKPELQRVDQLAARLAACADRVERERLERAMQARSDLGSAIEVDVPLWGWRWGDTLLFGTPAEAYSLLQRALRRQFPHRAVVVLNMVNGHGSYLAPASSYGTGTYQVDVSLYAAGGLERVLAACLDLARELEIAQTPRGAEDEPVPA